MKERRTMPGFHRPDRFVLSVMGDIRVAMEELMDAMAGVVTHDRAPILPCNGFAKQERSDEGLIRAKGRVEDSRNTHITLSDVTKEYPRFTNRDSSVQGLSGGPN